MVSVIIPTLNEGNYISHTISMLEKQTRLPKELIIVDAMSVDNTIEEIKKHSKIPTIILESPRRNASYQKNLGAKNASSDLLMFLDADIQLRNKHFIEMVSKKMRGHAGAFTDITIPPEKRKVLDTLILAPTNLFLRLTHKLFCFGARGGFMAVTKEAFNKVGGFNEEHAVAEDVAFFRKISKSGRVTHVPVVAYESPRRYRKQGYLKTLSLWTLNGLWISLFDKSFTKFWKDIR